MFDWYSSMAYRPGQGQVFNTDCTAQWMLNADRKLPGMWARRQSKTLLHYSVCSKCTVGSWLHPHMICSL